MYAHHLGAYCHMGVLRLSLMQIESVVATLSGAYFLQTTTLKRRYPVMNNAEPEFLKAFGTARGLRGGG